MAAISWAVLGLASGWIHELVGADQYEGQRRVGIYALPAAGAFLGGVLGAAFGLGWFSLIGFGAWHTAIVGAALLLWMHGAVPRVAASATRGA
jgi:uncharacterized membrane protein YeaQ/YmgE (transglycosylase-associated protein family)